MTVQETITAIRAQATGANAGRYMSMAQYVQTLYSMIRVTDGLPTESDGRDENLQAAIDAIKASPEFGRLFGA